jgi:hypothetical protein
MLFEVDKILREKSSTVENVSIVIEHTKLAIYDTFKKQLELQTASGGVPMHSDLPIEWSIQDDKYPLRIALIPSSEEYRSILKALRKTLPETHTQSVFIERIQNTRWYLQYQLEKKYLFDELKQETECRLFHGCPNRGDALESIIRNGFDRCLAGKNCGKHVAT